MKTWKNRRRNTRPTLTKTVKNKQRGGAGVPIDKRVLEQLQAPLQARITNGELLNESDKAILDKLNIILKRPVSPPGKILLTAKEAADLGVNSQTTANPGGLTAPRAAVLPAGFGTAAATPADSTFSQVNPMPRAAPPVAETDNTPEGTPEERAALVAPLSPDDAASRLSSALRQANPMARPIPARPAPAPAPAPSSGYPIYAQGALGRPRTLQDCETELAALKEKQRLDTGKFETTVSAKELEIASLKEVDQRRQAALELAKKQAALAEQAADDISKASQALRNADADSRDRQVGELREHLQTLKEQAENGPLVQMISDITATLDSIKGQSNQEVLAAIGAVKASIEANSQAMKTASDAASAELASVRADATRASQELSEAHAGRIAELNAAIAKADELRISAETRAQAAEANAPAAAREKARADALDENIARLRKELEDEKAAALNAAERAKASEETLRAAADAERTRAEAASVSAAQAEEAARAASAKSAGLEATNADIGTRLQAISDEKEAAGRSSAEAAERVRALETASAAAKDVSDAENARLIGEVRAAQAALEAARGEARAAAQAELTRIARERDEATAAAAAAAREMARQAEEARAAATVAAAAARDAAEAEAAASRDDRPQIIGAFYDDGRPVSGTDKAPVGTNIRIRWARSRIHHTGSSVLLVRNPADGSIVDSIFIDRTTASGGPDEFEVNYTIKLGGTTTATILDVIV
jgi:trimeric autotransporter adhesin